MRILAPLAVATFAFTSVTIAAAPTPPVSDEAHAVEDAAPAKPAKKPRKVCRTETATGSVMAKRVCYTPEQLKAQQKQTEEDLRNLKH